MFRKKSSASGSPLAKRSAHSPSRRMSPMKMKRGRSVPAGLQQPPPGIYASSSRKPIAAPFAKTREEQRPLPSSFAKAAASKVASAAIDDSVEQSENRASMANRRLPARVPPPPLPMRMAMAMPAMAPPKPIRQQQHHQQSVADASPSKHVDTPRRKRWRRQGSIGKSAAAALEFDHQRKKKCASPAGGGGGGKPSPMRKTNSSKCLSPDRGARETARSRNRYSTMGRSAAAGFGGQGGVALRSSAEMLEAAVREIAEAHKDSRVLLEPVASAPHTLYTVCKQMQSERMCSDGDFDLLATLFEDGPFEVRNDVLETMALAYGVRESVARLCRSFKGDNELQSRRAASLLSSLVLYSQESPLQQRECNAAMLGHLPELLKPLRADNCFVATNVVAAMCSCDMDVFTSLVAMAARLLPTTGAGATVHAGSEAVPGKQLLASLRSDVSQAHIAGLTALLHVGHSFDAAVADDADQERIVNAVARVLRDDRDASKRQLAARVIADLTTRTAAFSVEALDLITESHRKEKIDAVRIALLPGIGALNIDQSLSSDTLSSSSSSSLSLSSSNSSAIGAESSDAKSYTPRHSGANNDRKQKVLAGIRAIGGLRCTARSLRTYLESSHPDVVWTTASIKLLVRSLTRDGLIRKQAATFQLP
jgi:hypothetical protein